MRARSLLVAAALAALPAHALAAGAAKPAAPRAAPVTVAGALAGAADLAAQGAYGDAAALIRIALRFDSRGVPSGLDADTRFALALADALGGAGPAYPDRSSVVDGTLAALAAGKPIPDAAWNAAGDELAMLCDLVAFAGHFDGEDVGRSLEASSGAPPAAGEGGLRRCLAQSVLPLVAGSVPAAAPLAAIVSPSDGTTLAAIARRFALEGRHDQAAALCAALPDPAVRTAVSRSVVSARQLSGLKLKDEQLELALLQNWRYADGEAAEVFGQLFLSRASAATLRGRRAAIVEALDRAKSPLLERAARLALLEKLEPAEAGRLRPGEDQVPSRELLGFLAFAPKGQALDRWAAELPRQKLSPRMRGIASYLLMRRVSGDKSEVTRKKLLGEILAAARQDGGGDRVLVRLSSMALADAGRR